MFTWICPQCGREVPPAYTECPNCSGQLAAAKQPEEAEQTPKPPEDEKPAIEPARAAWQEAVQSPPAPPVAARPGTRSGRRPSGSFVALPTWLLAILFAFAFLGLGSGIYWLVGHFKGRTQASTPMSAVESPAAKPGTPTSPYQKYIEISGIRFLSDPKDKNKTLVRFTVTNHSEADFQDLAGNVTLWGRTQKSEEDAQGTFAFSTPLKPLESKDVTSPLTTNLKVYELPDWQNATADLQITRPGPTSSDSPGPR
jgi:hypothetical protein